MGKGFSIREVVLILEGCPVTLLYREGASLVEFVENQPGGWDLDEKFFGGPDDGEALFFD